MSDAELGRRAIQVAHHADANRGHCCWPPRGLQTTGDASFCTPWTYLGTPAVTLPLLQSGAGMPLGVQIIKSDGRGGGNGR